MDVWLTGPLKGAVPRLSKVVVANRGEIAVRVMRAATELGIGTVAMSTAADRESIHRVKADESYQIGDPDRPLAGYLDVEEIVELAVRVGADALYGLPPAGRTPANAATGDGEPVGGAECGPVHRTLNRMWPPRSCASWKAANRFGGRATGRTQPG